MALPPRRIAPSAWLPVGVDYLEPNAEEVVRSLHHRCVVASPGSGKTELLAQRAAFLLQTGTCRTPRRILAISFKRDAARNLAQRVNERCHTEYASRFDSMTFDSFAKGLLDRFGQALPLLWRPTPDYEVVLTRPKDAISSFLRSARTNKGRVGTEKAISDLLPSTFEKYQVLFARLPIEGWLAPTPAQWAGGLFWEEALRAADKSALTFPMIGRLAELLLRTNIAARNALALTYSHVFLDEFQDATAVQYELVRTAFGGAATTITAVGDHKQQIMRWAHAMEDPFGQFERDFRCVRTSLHHNYRSSPQLVHIQHVLARALDSHSAYPQAQVANTIFGESCMLWDFSAQSTEAAFLSRFVYEQIRSQGLRPSDFVILVRQKPESYFPALATNFAALGIVLRNEAGIVGHLPLQDLMMETLSEVVVLLLRVATTRAAGTDWGRAVALLASLSLTAAKNDDFSDELPTMLDQFTRDLYRQFPFPPQAEVGTKIVVATIVNFLGRERLLASTPSYAQGGWFEKVEESVARHLWTSSQNVPWAAALDNYEGRNSVSLMTVHKSKGLEYHTVMLIGLDDSAWWSFNKDPVEAKSTFFVALSRARQRVVFSHCLNGARITIAPLYQLMQAAGVTAVYQG